MDNEAGVAVVGASPRNFWSLCAIRNLAHFGGGRPIWPVTPTSSEVEGHPAFASIDQLPGTPAAAIVAVRRDRCPGLVADLAKLGTPTVVVVSDGFAERADEEGRRLQDELVRACDGFPTRLVGPNCVGVADFTAGLCAIAEPIPFTTRPGEVSFVTQSGALLSSTLSGFAEEGVGIDWCISIGNGATVSVPGAISIAAARATTSVIGVYMEGLPHAGAVEDFTTALAAAADAGKTVIILKSGVSDRGRRVALSHTASISGADAVFSATLAEYGALRADSVDELIRLATVVRLGAKPGRSRRVAVVGSSGGVAALSSDLAQRHGVDLSTFSPETMAALTASSGPGSFVENPFDIIGKPGANEGRSDDIYGAVYRDPDVGFVVAPFSVNLPDDTAERETHRQTFRRLADLAAQHGVPTLITTVPVTEWTDWAQTFRAENPHINLVRGMATTFAALGKIFPATTSATTEPPSAAVAGLVRSEGAARDLLETAGVPVVPGVVIPDGAVAADTVEALRPPFAVKVVAPVSHKAAIGGVELGVAAQDVDAAIARVRANVLASGLDPGDLHGCLVEEMVFGRELLVGLQSDPLFGRYLVVGLGGAATELAGVAVTSRLPVTTDDIAAMLVTIGVTDSPHTVAFIARAAAQFIAGALADAATVEINPAIISADRCLAADALVVDRG
jgi:acyl-CoA synthetase (NDP forming)